MRSPHTVGSSGSGRCDGLSLNEFLIPIDRFGLWR